MTKAVLHSSSIARLLEDEWRPSGSRCERAAEAAIAPGDAELRLYDRLGARYPDRDPYALYCACLDQLVSFRAALGRIREREGA